MKRADTLETRIERMATRVDVAYLRMHQAMERRAIDQYAAADSGAHRQVDQVRQVSPCAPTVLRQSRRVPDWAWGEPSRRPTL